MDTWTEQSICPNVQASPGYRWTPNILDPEQDTDTIQAFAA